MDSEESEGAEADASASSVGFLLVLFSMSMKEGSDAPAMMPPDGTRRNVASFLADDGTSETPPGSLLASACPRIDHKLIFK